MTVKLKNRRQLARLKRNPTDIHLRTKEETALGITEFISICGFRSTRNLEVSKSLRVVTCAACLRKVNKK